MSHFIISFLAAAFLPPVSAYGWVTLLRLLRRVRFLIRDPLKAVLEGWMTSGCWGLTAATFWLHDAGWATGSAVTLAVAFGAWWWRKRRGKARAWLGAKSKALRDALVRRMPKPVVLRPVRGAA